MYGARVRFDLFSSNKLWAVLKQEEMPDLPRPRTLQDWIRYDSAPEAARQFVLDRVLNAKEEAAPSSTERLERAVDRLTETVDKLGKNLDRTIKQLGKGPLSDAGFDEAVARSVEKLGLRKSPPDGASRGGSPKPRDTAGKSSQRRP